MTIGVSKKCNITYQEEHSLLEAFSTIFLQAALPYEPSTLLYQIIETTDVSLQFA